MLRRQGKMSRYVSVMQCSKNKLTKSIAVLKQLFLAQNLKEVIFHSSAVLENLPAQHQAYIICCKVESGLNCDREKEQMGS